MRSWAKVLLATLAGTAVMAVLAAVAGGKGANANAVARALRGVLTNETAPAPAAPAQKVVPAAGNAAPPVQGNASRKSGQQVANGTQPAVSRTQPVANRRQPPANSTRPAVNQTQPRANRTQQLHPAIGRSNATNKTAGNQTVIAGGHCLCLFDIDRTLTGRQGDQCNGRNKVISGVWDPAYGGGTLTLSALGRAGVGSTWCGGCKIGVISAGSGGGRGMRGTIAGRVLGGRAGHSWSGPNARTPLIVGCHDSRKASCARGIRNYYKRRGTYIPRENVYHYDDKASSVSSFKGSGMNAMMVSCSSRSGSHGGCGGTTGEVKKQRGVHFCR